MSQILYLAVPFTHSSPKLREHRFQTACRAAAKLMTARIVIFSPLSHSVPIAQYGNLDDMDHAYWMAMDIPHLERSDELLIIALDGWKESRGVKEEMLFALENNMPITMIEEKDIENLPKIPRTARRFLKSRILTQEYENE